MDHNPDRIAVWPGYFDAKVSRRSGRRVPRDSSVLNQIWKVFSLHLAPLALEKSSVRRGFPIPIDHMLKKADFGFPRKAQRNLSVLGARRKSCN